MLLESLVKTTVELQGFRVGSVTGAPSGIHARIVLPGAFLGYKPSEFPS